MKNLTPEELLMCVTPGAPIHLCKMEAIQTCAAQQVNVAFVHNGTKYLVEWGELFNQVKSEGQ